MEKLSLELYKWPIESRDIRLDKSRYIVIISDISYYIAKMKEGEWELISSPELFSFSEGYWPFCQ